MNFIKKHLGSNLGRTTILSVTAVAFIAGAVLGISYFFALSDKETVYALNYLDNSSFTGGTTGWTLSGATYNSTYFQDSAGSLQTSASGRNASAQQNASQSIGTSISSTDSVYLSLYWSKQCVNVNCATNDISVQIAKPSAPSTWITIWSDTSLPNFGSATTWAQVNSVNVSSTFDETGTYNFRVYSDLKAGNHASAGALAWYDNLVLDVVGPIPETYALTMAENNPAWGTATDVTGTSPYVSGTIVNILAEPSSGYQFVNWTAPTGSFGNANATSTTFTMPAQAVTVTANFEAIPAETYALTMAENNPAWGTATDVTGTSPYTSGAVVSILATPNPGWEFVNWTAPAGTFGNANATSTTFTMPAQVVTVTANFQEEGGEVLGDWINKVGTGKWEPDTINSVSASAANNVWILGSSGQVWQYDGSVWTRHNRTGRWGTTSMRSIFALDSNNVWATGINGHIWHYNGSTWTQHDGTGLWGTSYIYSVFAIDTNNVWIGGSSGHVWHYNGSTWTRHSGTGLWGANAINSVFAIDADANNVWIGGASGHVWYYNGSAWTQHDGTGLWGTSAINSVFAIDANNVWIAGGSGHVWHYNGSTWTQHSGTGRWETSSINSVFASAANNVWIVGNIGTASKSVWQYNGTAWTQHNGGWETATNFYSVFALTNGDVWIGGGLGNVSLSDIDGGGGSVWHYNGTAWTQHGGSGKWGTLLVRSISVLNTSNVWIGSSFGNVWQYDGSVWTRHNRTGRWGTETIHSVSASASNNVWVGGTNGHLWYYNGSTWTRHAPGWGTNTINSVSASATNNVWIAGSVVWRYNGSTWTQHDGTGLWGANAINSVFAIDANNVWIGGASGHVWRYNGSAWTQHDGTGLWGTSAIKSVFAIDANNVWIGGDSGHVWQYNGSTWTQHSGTGRWETSIINSVSAFDTNNVWIGGASGHVWHYNGSTWTRHSGAESWGTVSINSISASVYNNVWFGGGGGYIWQYSEGEPSNTTTLATGTDPASATVAPESGIRDAGAFTLKTNSGTDSVTALTVTLAGLGTPYDGLAEVRITSDNGATTYFSAVTSFASNAVSFSGGTAIPVSTTETQFKIRITPLSHAIMPAPPGAEYNLSPYVSLFTSTNAQSGSDSNLNTLKIDNLSPANVTSATVTAGDAQNSLSWTNPADADFSQSIVLRRANMAVADAPVEGTTYTAGNPLGNSTVACVVNAPTASCTDTGLINDTAYHYKIFTKDTNGNYSASGVVPTGSPATPTGLTSTVTQENYRWYENTNNITPTTALALENVDIESVARKPVLRLRMNIKSADAELGAGQVFKLQFATSTVGVWSDVGATSSSVIWRGYDNASVSDGATITSSVLTGSPVALQTYEEESPSASTPNAIASNGFGEFDWVLQNWRAEANTTYYFRIIYNNGTPLDGYTNYPAVTTVSQASWLAGENTATSTEKGTSVRLRIAVANTSTEPAAYQYKVEYAVKPSGQECSAAGTWTLIPTTATSEHWKITSTNYFYSREGVSGILTNPELYSFTSGFAVEGSDFSAQQITLGENEYTELEFALMATNDAQDGSTYCFRLVNAELDGYDTYPEMTIGGTPALTQTHYRWRNDDNSEANATWAANEDVYLNNLEKEENIRLRIQVANTGASADPAQFRLEYATSTGGTWIQVPGTATSELWEMISSTNFTDGASTTAKLTAGATTFVAGQIKDAGSQTGNITLDSDTYTEVEYSIRATADAVSGDTYYFRVTDAGEAFSSENYENYAMVTIKSEPLPLGQVIGSLESATIDTQRIGGVTLVAIVWQGTLNAGTKVDFQIAVSNNSAGPWNFFGPGGDTDSWYGNACPNVGTGTAGSDTAICVDRLRAHGYKYIRYKIRMMSDESGLATPEVDDIILIWAR